MAITNDFLKFRKVIEFEQSCIVICYSYVYLIIDEEYYLLIKKFAKNLRN